MLRRQYISQNVQTLVNTECGGNKSEFDRLIGKNVADRLINRRVNARQSTLELIAEKFNVTVEWLESDNTDLSLTKGGDAVVPANDGYLQTIRELTRAITQMAGNSAEVEKLKDEILRLQKKIDDLERSGDAPEKGRSLNTG